MIAPLKIAAISFILSCSYFFALAQDSLHVNKKRLLIVSGTHTVAGIAIGTGLYQLWYKDYNTGKFHFFNDNNEWLQMDKVGHGVSNFYASSILCSNYEWAGLSPKKSMFIGSAVNLTYFTAIEVMDGFSRGWGFSWGDVIANVSGTSLFILQKSFLPNEPVALKFSFQKSPYAKLRPNLLGENLSQNILKDYNGQTYWMTVNPFKFKQQSDFKWYKIFNVALGYGADGMIGGTENPIMYMSYKRYRQYYLSLDIDWTSIPVKSVFAKRVLKCINFIKFPLPTIELSNNKVSFHALR